MHLIRLVSLQIAGMLSFVTFLAVFPPFRLVHWAIGSIVTFILLMAWLIPRGINTRQSRNGWRISGVLAVIGVILTGWTVANALNLF